MNINAALGMTSERPLPTGIYYENKYELRRVDPPLERDDVADLRRQLADISADYSELLSSIEKARESLQASTLCDNSKQVLLQWLTKSIGNSPARTSTNVFLNADSEIKSLKEQLSQVTKERDEYKQRAGSNQSYGVDFGSACGRNYLSVCGFVVAVEGDTQRDSKLASRFGSPWNKDAINYVVEQSKEKDGEIDTLRDQLATAQAEAAAMRRFVDEVYRLTTDYPRPNDDGGYRLSNWITVECKKFMRTTAGRELLDEMKRKDERTRELEAKLSNAVSVANDLSEKTMQCGNAYGDELMKRIRLERKANAAKLAYVETLRGKIDPAWFGKAQYRCRGSKCIWKTNDGVRVITSIYPDRDGWVESGDYQNWQACCDDPTTYPCDEHGNRIEESMNIKKVEHVECNCGGTITHMAVVIEDQAQRIADLERQLAKHGRDAELCQELRAWIKNGVFSVVGNSVVIGCQCVPTELAELLISIRDGGAK